MGGRQGRAAPGAHPRGDRPQPRPAPGHRPRGRGPRPVRDRPLVPVPGGRRRPGLLGAAGLEARPSPRRARPPARPTRTGAPASRSPGRSTSSAASAGRRRRPSPPTSPRRRAGARRSSRSWRTSPPRTSSCGSWTSSSTSPGARVQTNEETVQFYEKRLQGGVSNRLEVDRAVANRARTAVVIPQIEQQIAVAENALCLLLGRPPGPIERGGALTDEHVAAGGPGRPPGVAPRAASRRPRGRAAAGGVERQRRRGEGPLLPHHLAHGHPRHDQRRLLEPPEGRLEHLAGEPEPLRADLPGRPDPPELRRGQGPLRPGPGPVPEGGPQLLPRGGERDRHREEARRGAPRARGRRRRPRRTRPPSRARATTRGSRATSRS